MTTFYRENKYPIPGKAQRSPTNDSMYFQDSKMGENSSPLDLSTPKKALIQISAISEENDMTLSPPGFASPSLQFCDDDNVAEDEVFFGAVTELEKKKARKFHNRRTVVFFPGFRKDPQLMRRTINEANRGLQGEVKDKGRPSQQPLDLRKHETSESDISETRENEELSYVEDSAQSDCDSVYCYSRISGVEPLDLTNNKSATILNEGVCSMLNNARLSSEMSIGDSASLTERNGDFCCQNDSVLPHQRNSVISNVSSISSMNSVSEIDDSHVTLNNARLSETCQDTDNSETETGLMQRTNLLEDTANKSEIVECLTKSEAGATNNKSDCSETTLNRSFIENSIETGCASLEKEGESTLSFVENSIGGAVVGTGDNVPDEVGAQASNNAPYELQRSNVQDIVGTVFLTPAAQIPPCSSESNSSLTSVHGTRNEVSRLDLNADTRFSAFSSYTPTKQTQVRMKSEPIEPENRVTHLQPQQHSVTAYTSPSQYFPSLNDSESPVSAFAAHAQPKYFGSLSPFKNDDNSSIFHPCEGNNFEVPTEPNIAVTRTLPTRSPPVGKSSKELFVLNQPKLADKNCEMNCFSLQVITNQPTAVSAVYPMTSAHQEYEDPTFKALVCEEEEAFDVEKENKPAPTTADCTTDKLSEDSTTQAKDLQIKLQSCEKENDMPKYSPQSSVTVEPNKRVLIQLPLVNSLEENVCKDSPVSGTKISNEEYVSLLEAKKEQLRKLRVEREKLQDKLRLDKEYAKLSQLHSPMPKKAVSKYPELPQVLPKAACVGRPSLVLNQKELDAVTKLHTICNSKQVTSMLQKETKQVTVLKEIPVNSPRIKWRDNLVHPDACKYSPSKAEQKWGKSILSQKQVQNSSKSRTGQSPTVYSALRKTNTLGKDS